MTRCAMSRRCPAARRRRLQRWDERMSFPGTIELDESDAAPLIGGRIVELRVDEGDSVKAGDTLAVLTQSSLPATVEERRARLAMARARLADLGGVRGRPSCSAPKRSWRLPRRRRIAPPATWPPDQPRREPRRPRAGAGPATAAAATAARRRDAARATGPCGRATVPIRSAPPGQRCAVPRRCSRGRARMCASWRFWPRSTAWCFLVTRTPERWFPPVPRS